MRNIIGCIIAIIIMMVIVSCSTQHNTIQTRFWHAFNARYNTYFNGNQAYIEGSLEKERGNKDNYTEIIPFYTVGNKASRELGKSNFETAITKSQKAIKMHSIKKKPLWNKDRKKTEKDIEWLNRREYNPFIWKAWMLMGRSQFQQGLFDEAAATFSYMSRLFRTQPGIYGKARAWLAKCYIEQDWIYDAEDVIRNMQRDSIDWRAQKEWDFTLADYYVHIGEFGKAVPYLKQSIKHEMRAKQRAREWYLLGQVLASLGRNDEAYSAFQHVVRQNPPYELEFNARISMTEVMPSGRTKAKLSKLKAMARSDKNKDYLDQVYYAMGNVYLAENDTLNAIYAYEKGNDKATRSGIEKGVLLLHLGDLYWEIEKFSDAQRCYGEAIGLLDKERKDYALLAKRSKILDELCPYTDAIHLQDSLQALAKMDVKERNEAIDRVIEELKRKEKEERLNKLEEELQKNGTSGNTLTSNQNTPTLPTLNMGSNSNVWYFYNATAIQQGKQMFQKQWGKRVNEDDWQRVNKTVVNFGNDIEDVADNEYNSLNDSIQGDNNIDKTDSRKENKDTTALDPHKREYYLAQIPFTEEQLASSNQILADGLFHSGIIFKDKLDNLKLSEKALLRLTSTFPEFGKTDEIWYHLFLLYSRKDNHDKAVTYIDSLKSKYPDSQWTQILTDPYFKENALYGVHLEDSLYADTYDAFRNDVLETVEKNYLQSTERFPMGIHRDKFIFITGLSALNNGNPDSCMTMMHKVVTDYPQSDVATLAGMIIKGVEAGRRLHGAKFDIADIWNYRTTTLAGDSTENNKHFIPERNTEFMFVMTYNPDSLNENQLLYEMAKYNFTSFLIRNFDIEIENFEGLHRMNISGFRNYDEALMYTRLLYQNASIMSMARGSRNIIISTQNYPLLGVTFSYNDYDNFYKKHFSPLHSFDINMFNEPEITPEEYDPEITVSDENSNISEETNDNNTVNEDEGIIITDDAETHSKNNTNNNEFVLPDTTTPLSSNNNVPTNEIIIPDQGYANSTVISQDQKDLNKQKEKVNETVLKSTPLKQPVKQQVTKQSNNQQTLRQQIYNDVIEIIDDNNNTKPNTTKTKKVETQKDDDEYFELEGF